MESANIFYGTDTYGTHIEVAIRKEDNQFFWRSYSFNGYGMGWKKWEKIESFEIFINSYGKEAIKWGWNELTGCVGKPRLPKLEKEYAE
jgi:hypothetical protein